MDGIFSEIKCLEIMLLTSKRNKEEGPSEFLRLEGIEYFLFEEDFMERNIRCIPMIIRFKMDQVGIKLKLSEWNRFNTEERVQLALMPCFYHEEIDQYHCFLGSLVKKYTGRDATTIEIDEFPLWGDLCVIPEMLVKKLNEYEWSISVKDWKELTNLQRFALLKLCRPKHENKNFPRAMKEFHLIN